MVNGTLLKAKSWSQGAPQGAVCSPILFTLTYIIFYGFFTALRNVFLVNI